MTVYITQNPMKRDAKTGDLIHMFDLTPAREYGNLVVLLPAGPVLITPSEAVKQLKAKLAHFTDDDHLLCLGDPVAIAAASAIVSDVNDGVIPLLVWDRHQRKYLSCLVDIHKRLTAA